MRMRLRPRYYCDFCKKVGGSAGHMKRHESACTANPNRVCRMCIAAGLTQAAMPALIEAAKCDAQQPVNSKFDLPPINKLQEVANGCPACILSALRASGVILAFFDFNSAVGEFWLKHGGAT